MSILKKIFLIIAAIFFQATVLSLFEIHSVKPDLVLVVVISISLLEGIEAGMTFGFISGLAEDILCGGIIGLNAFTKTLVGFLIGIFKEKLYGTSIITQSIIALISSMLQGVIVFLILNLFQFNVSFTDNFIYIIFPGAIYNILLIILLFPKIKKILQPRRIA